MTTLAPAQTASGPPNALRQSRQWQLLACMLATMAVSSPQYVWTLFIAPLRQELGLSLAATQVTFSILIATQCCLGPLYGWLADRFGPRATVTAGAVLTGLSWVLAAHAAGPWTLYLTYGLMGGVGTGLVYVTTVTLAGRLYPERRGLAIGLVAAGYGFGAIVTTAPVAGAIARNGYHSTLVLFGILSLVACGAAAQVLRRSGAPSAPPTVPMPSSPSGRDIGWREMLATPIFWLMFAMMVMMSAGGLMAVSQLGPLSADFGVGKALVFGMAALPLALTFDRACNGFTRPFFGWVSDRIGREQTMALAFFLEAGAILVLLKFGTNPVAFVVMSGAVFFAWGEIFSLFPAMVTDLFGSRNASVNYGFLYMAQGIGSVLGGPLAALLREHSPSWTPVFQIVSGMDLLTAALAYFALRPLRLRYMTAG